MGDSLLAEFQEYDSWAVVDDILYFVDVTGPTKKKIKAQRFVFTDGNRIGFTGGGTVALGGFTLTAEGTSTAIDKTTTQTMLYKTLTAPTIADLTNIQHDHSDNADGRGLTVLTGMIKLMDCPIGAGLDHCLKSEDDTTWPTHQGPYSLFYLNGDHLGLSPTVRLHAWAYTGAEGKEAELRLYNETLSASVSYSTATGTSDGGWHELLSSNFNISIASGLNKYSLHVRCDTADTFAYVANACLKVEAAV